MTRLIRSIAVLALVAAGLWVALLNQAPPIQNDSVSYAYNGRYVTDRVAQALPGHSEAGGTANPLIHPISQADPRWLPSPERSIFYSMLAYLGYATSSFWITALIQSCLFVYVCRLLLVRGLRLTPVTAFVTLCAVLATSAASFYVCSIMPDIFTGILIVSLALLLIFKDRIGRGDFTLVFLIAAFSVLSHATNLLLTVAVLLLVPFALRRRRSNRTRTRPSPSAWSRALILLLLIGVGFGGDLLYRTAIRNATGIEPIRAPFITARLLADGPGYAFLKDGCASRPFVVCDYLSRMPISDDTFLWSTDPARGVYMTVDQATRKQLSDEQIPLALAEVGHNPAAQILASARNAAVLFGKFGLGAFDIERTHDSVQSFLDEGLPDNHIAVQDAALTTHGSWLHLAGAFFLVVYLLSMASALLVLLFWRRIATSLGLDRSDASRWFRFVLLTVYATVANAVICGTLSGSYSRYQGRLSWVPVLTFWALVTFALFRQLRDQRNALVLNGAVTKP